MPPFLKTPSYFYFLTFPRNRFNRPPPPPPSRERPHGACFLIVGLLFFLGVGTVFRQTNFHDSHGYFFIRSFRTLHRDSRYHSYFDFQTRKGGKGGHVLYFTRISMLRFCGVYNPRIIPRLFLFLRSRNTSFVPAPNGVAAAFPPTS